MILVDKHDKPMLQAIGNGELQNEDLTIESHAPELEKYHLGCLQQGDGGILHALPAVLLHGLHNPISEWKAGTGISPGPHMARSPCRTKGYHPFLSLFLCSYGTSSNAGIPQR
ncbi:hypothetical protein [Prevotella dentasini]